MSALRDAADRLSRHAPRPLLTSERLFATERAAARLESRRIGAARAVSADDVEAIDAHGLRRLLDTIWSDPQRVGIAAPLVARAHSLSTRSLDRAIILAYLRHFPADHSAFAHLQAAAGEAAHSHDWAWAERGERWRLWTNDGPATVRAAIVAGEIGDTGLLRLLAGSAFLAATPVR